MHRACSCLCGCGTKLEVAWLTIARGTIPARSSCDSWISVSTSCVAARLAGYSTCQAIQRLPSGSGKLSIFRSTWSTRWKPVSDLSEQSVNSQTKSVSKWWQSEKHCFPVMSFNLLSALLTRNGKCTELIGDIWSAASHCAYYRPFAAHTTTTYWGMDPSWPLKVCWGIYSPIGFGVQPSWIRPVCPAHLDA